MASLILSLVFLIQAKFADEAMRTVPVLTAVQSVSTTTSSGPGATSDTCCKASLPGLSSTIAFVFIATLSRRDGSSPFLPNM